MARLNLKKMSIDDILKAMDFDFFERENIISYNQLNFVMIEPEYFDELVKENGYEKNDISIYNFIKNNPDLINKENLVYCIAENSKKRLEHLRMSQDNINGLLDQLSKRFQICLELLQNSNIQIPIIKIDETGKYNVFEYKIIEDLLGDNNKKTKRLEKMRQIKEEKTKRINKINEDIEIEKFMFIGNEFDMQELYSFNKEQGQILDFISYNMYKDLGKKDLTSEEIHQIETKTKTEWFIKNIELYDIDKFLLTSAYRAKRIMEENMIDNDIFNKLCVSIMEKGEQYIENEKTTIEGKIRITDKLETIKYTYKQLKEDVKRIKGGRYYSKEDLSIIKKSVFEGKCNVLELMLLELDKLITFSFKEKEMLIESNKDNVQYLTIAGLLNKNQVRDIIFEMKDYEFDQDFLDYLKISEIINQKDIVQLYLNDTVNIQTMIDIKSSCDLKSEVTVEKLMEMYQTRQYNSDNMKNFEKYILLFRELNLKDEEEENKNYIFEKIVEELYKSDNDYKDDFKNLYEANILPIDTLIDWNGDDIIYELIKTSSLKPKDAKSLLISGELDIERTYNALVTSNLSNTQKMNFILSSFDGSGNDKTEVKLQKDVRYKLIQALNISKQYVELCNELKEDDSRRKKTNQDKKKGNCYVLEPAVRWKLMGTIDKDYQTHVYSDNTVIFILPNVDGGKVIFEKMYENTKKDGVRIRYGSATYIMNYNDFCNNKNDIVKEDKISTKALGNMIKNDKADKFNHTLHWGRNLTNALNISSKSGYSQEQIDRINDVVEELEETREILER